MIKTKNGTDNKKEDTTENNKNDKTDNKKDEKKITINLVSNYKFQKL